MALPIEPSDEAEYLAAVREGLEDIRAGRVVEYAQVRRWLLSWGSDAQLPAPEAESPPSP